MISRSGDELPLNLEKQGHEFRSLSLLRDSPAPMDDLLRSVPNHYLMYRQDKPDYHAHSMTAGKATVDVLSEPRRVLSGGASASQPTTSVATTSAHNARAEVDTEPDQREKSQAQLAEALSATVTAMASAMEKRDWYTAGHQDRVAHIAYAIGKELGWTEQRLQGLHMAAQLHDIGKISVPVELLTKPTRLTKAEFNVIKGHSETGYHILKGIPFSWPIADIVHQHHEKLNGSGYPLGLKGDAILPESRVLAVADILESMASDRPYRRAHDLDVALAEIERQAGTLLDPEAVKACLSLFREKNFDLPQA